MSKYKIFACLGMCFCISCNAPVKDIEVYVDLEKRISLDAVTDYLQPDSLICVSSGEHTIANFDRIIRRGEDVFILDKIQQVVFKANTSTRSLQRIVNCRGNAQNEYISITDIATDKDGNVYVFDSESRKINKYDANGRYLKTIGAVYGSSMAISDKEIAINTNQLDDNQVAVFSLSGELLYQTAPCNGQTQKYTLDDIGSVVAMGDKFLYTTSFDFNVYQADKDGAAPFVSLNLGGKQFDARELEKLDYPAYQKMLMSNSDKVMSLRYLCVYGNLIFLSTDDNTQLIYDTNRNTVLTISKVESPYNILFSSPLSVSADGQFCVALNSSNITDGYFPWFKTNETKLPQLQTEMGKAGQGDNSFWLLMGHAR